MNDVRTIVRKKSGRTVFWGLQLLPKAKREALYTLIAFSRHLEEVIEDSSSQEEKQEILNMWQKELDNIYDKKVPATEIGRRIYKNCMRFKLPKKEFENLLDTMSKNIDNPMQAPTMRQFTGYCRKVGGMTSSLSLRILGCKDEELIKELSSSLGSALQITGILRNIKEDAKNNRMYIPQEMLQKAGITATEPTAVLVDKNLHIARQYLAEIADRDYIKSYELIKKLDKETSKTLQVILDIHNKVFTIMQNRGWEIMSPKPEISKLYKLKCLIKAIVG